MGVDVKHPHARCPRSTTSCNRRDRSRRCRCSRRGRRGAGAGISRVSVPPPPQYACVRPPAAGPRRPPSRARNQAVADPELAHAVHVGEPHRSARRHNGRGCRPSPSLRADVILTGSGRRTMMPQPTNLCGRERLHEDGEDGEHRPFRRLRQDVPEQIMAKLDLRPTPGRAGRGCRRSRSPASVESITSTTASVFGIGERPVRQRASRRRSRGSCGRARARRARHRIIDGDDHRDERESCPSGSG